MLSMLPARRRRLRQIADRRGDVLAVGLAIVVLVSLLGNAGHYGRPAELLLALGAIPPLFMRRSRPYLALLLAVAADAIMPSNRTLVLPVMAVLYTIASQTPWRVGVALGSGAAVVTIIAGATWSSATVADHQGLLGYAIGDTACYGAAVALGLYVGARRRVLEALRERAERLDRERELLADRAVAEERVRIAQELHDIVAHNVSLMVVKAQALGATVDDGRVTESTESIADLGRQAMTEMHTTLRLLRSGNGGGPELDPQPGLAQVERLIEQSRGAGLEIELEVEGRPRPLAQGIDLSAFRIIQEALTNVVKHASGATTKVTISYQEGGVQLTITDRGAEIRRVLLEEPPDGHGVIGMRERAALFGGTLSTEAFPGGFKVTATLPYVSTAL
jgi:signal transduction histidine kinase